MPAQEFVIPEEEAEWVGLTLEEAVEKQRLLEEKVSVHECQLLLPFQGWAESLNKEVSYPLMHLYLLLHIQPCTYLEEVPSLSCP